MKSNMTIGSKVIHVLEAIPPYCKEVRTPAVILEFRGERVLLQEIENERFLIDAPLSSFEPSNS